MMMMPFGAEIFLLAIIGFFFFFMYQPWLGCTGQHYVFRPENKNFCWSALHSATRDGGWFQKHTIICMYNSAQEKRRRICALEISGIFGMMNSDDAGEMGFWLKREERRKKELRQENTHDMYSSRQAVMILRSSNAIAWRNSSLRVPLFLVRY